MVSMINSLVKGEVSENNRIPTGMRSESPPMGKFMVDRTV